MLAPKGGELVVRVEQNRAGAVWEVDVKWKPRVTGNPILALHLRQEFFHERQHLCLLVAVLADVAAGTLVGGIGYLRVRERLSAAMSVFTVAEAPPLHPLCLRSAAAVIMAATLIGAWSWRTVVSAAVA